jgi:hypothetical protein
MSTERSECVCHASPSFSKERLFTPAKLQETSIGYTCRGFAAVASSFLDKKHTAKYLFQAEYFNPNTRNLATIEFDFFPCRRLDWSHRGKSRYLPL